MTKTRDSVVPRSDTRIRMLPGSPTPRSGVYDHVGRRGDRPDEQSTRGEPLPAPRGNGRSWVFDRPTRGEK